jgi:hypothetical protein
VRRVSRAAIVFAACALFAGGFVAACRQGEGERCQVNDDCEDPLVCVEATHTCATSNSSMGIDATIPLDAPDAMPDAPDAM